MAKMEKDKKHKKQIVTKLTLSQRMFRTAAMPPVQALF